MKWTFEYVESLSLTTFNYILEYLSLHPPLELIAASYLGMSWGQDIQEQKEKERKELAYEFKDIDFDSIKMDVKIYDETLLERTKNLYKEYEEENDGERS